MDTAEEINRGLRCKYCGEPTVLADSSEIFRGAGHGRIYLCRACRAYVFCHKGTTDAMGSVANAELRALRKRAHGWFDAIWRNKLKKSRYNAYSWLSLRLDMNKDYAHMGLFDEEDCRRVIGLCSDYIRRHNPALWEKLNAKLSV